MSNILAAGTSQAASADFTVAAGTPTTVAVNTADGELPVMQAYAAIQIKSAAGQYMTVGYLGRNSVALVIDGPGVFRVLRFPTPVPIGIDRD